MTEDQTEEDFPTPRRPRHILVQRIERGALATYINHDVNELRAYDGASCVEVERALTAAFGEAWKTREVTPETGEQFWVDADEDGLSLLIGGRVS